MNSTTARDPSSAKLDIVIPLYNEQEIVRNLVQRLAQSIQKLPFSARVIFVDDGSRDQTIPRLLGVINRLEHVELLQLSRNFGQAAAIQAGLAVANADAVILMDGDLQDPPELIPELVDSWMLGSEVVIARRTDRTEETWSRKQLFQAFHWFFQRVTDLPIPQNCGTFCLLDRRAVAAVVQMPEVHRFFPGLRAWVGFDQCFVDYSRPKRAGGAPKQSFRRLMRYAFDGIFGFSRKPAQWLWQLGGLQLVFATVLFAISIGILWNDSTASWFPWVALSGGLSLFSGLQFVALGVLAELMFRVYDQSKLRPNYFISQQLTLKASVDEKSLSRRAG